MTGYGELEARLRGTAMARRIPVSAAFCLTHRCNLDCLHCYLRDDRGRLELSTSAWCGLVDQAAALGCLWLTLTGGEPTLRPDFAEIYRHAKRRGLLVIVMTNGTLLDEGLLSLLTEWPPHFLDVSLYAFEREPYAELTGVDVRDRVYASVEELVARRIRVRVKTTVTKQNLEELPAIAAWATEHGLCYRVDGDLCPTLRGDRSVQEHRVPPSSMIDLDRFRRDDVARAPECGAAQSGFYVGPDGALSACLLDTPVAQASRLGAAWNGSLQARRAALLRPPPACSGCQPVRCAPLIALEDHLPPQCCEIARLESTGADADGR